MRKRYFNIVFVIIFSVLYIYARQLREGIDCVPGEILVVYKKGVSESKIKAFHKAKGLSEIKTFFTTHEKKDKVYHLKLKPGITVEQAIEEYKKNPDVEIVQPNYIYYPCIFPNDTYFPYLWGLHNTGQTVNGTTGTPDADIDAPEAWDISTGTNTVVVAVIDSGIAYNHPDLQTNIWTNPGEIPNNGIDDDNNGFVDDYYGWDFFSEDNDPLGLDEHGTHVAGIIGAVGNNNNGVCGVNWNVKIMALRGMGIDHVKLYGTTSSLTPCINYAVSMGAKIINASWGRVGGYDLIQYNAINSAKNSGVLFVASAGNKGMDNDIYPHYPSNYDLDNIIAVAATDQNDNLASFSNYGLTSVDVAAPGVNIYSTIPIISSGPPINLYYENFDDGQAQNWTYTPSTATWGIVSNEYYSWPYSLTDSPSGNYPNNEDTIVYYNYKIPYVADNYFEIKCKVYYSLEGNWYDVFGIVVSSDKINWIWISSVTGSSYDWVSLSGTLDPDKMSIDFRNGFYFGFRLKTDYLFNYDGVYIDDVEVNRYPVNISYSLDFGDGTSAAAPYVSGLAALLLSVDPSLTYSQLKQIIMNTVDVKPSLYGKCVTSGRINAFSAMKYVLNKTICEAVDNSSFTWEPMAGVKPWFKQTSVYYYDSDAAQSAPIGDSSSSTIKTTVYGEGTLVFYWKVSSEENFDYLKFYIDGVVVSSITGETGWIQQKFYLGPGSHTLCWSYEKDATLSRGYDCGWLDKVQFYRPPKLVWTGEPGYENDGVEPNIGDDQTNFTFRIKYISEDGLEPAPGCPEVCINLGPFMSYPILVSSMTYVSGTPQTGMIYTFSIKLADPDLFPSSTYWYWFDAYDEIDTPITYDNRKVLFSTGPFVPNHAPRLTYGHVSPDVGTSTDTFVFSVEYIDEDGDWPLSGYPKVSILRDMGQFWWEIPGSPFTMNYVSGNPSNGAIYSCTVNLSSGNYSYKFIAKDDGSHGVVSDAYGAATQYQNGPIVETPVVNTPPQVVNTPPQLVWTGEEKYISDGLNYEVGGSSTVFIFRIKYIDSDNDPPLSGYPKLHIKKGDTEISGSPFSMNYVSGSYNEGAIYSYSIMLPYGTDYSYYFEAYDVHNDSATGEPILPIDAPDVKPTLNIVSISPDIAHSINILPESGEVNILIPEYTFIGNATIVISTSETFPFYSWYIKPTKLGIKVISEEEVLPTKDLTITWYYRDSDISVIDKRRLMIAWYDNIRNEYIPLPSVVYPEQNKIVATTNLLGYFAIVQKTAAENLSSVKVYPNPYKPGSGGPFDNSIYGYGIVFDNLTSYANIKIFNIAGEMIKEINETDNDGVYVWDTTSRSGDKVASGVYIYIISNCDSSGKLIDKKIGRLVIIR